MKICLDAGHGIETAGKCSPDGTYFEHEFNLDVAKRSKAHLERCGLQVVMTREDEHDISLAQRCKICNDAGCAYFISFHTNAAGKEGWYIAEDGTRWNTAEGLLINIVAVGGKAEELAWRIKRHAVRMLGCRDRGVQVANWAVIRDTNCPAVLIEHGFHTSRTEVEKLKSDAYRAKCAEADARGICEQVGVLWVPEAQPQPELPWYAEDRAWAMAQGISDGTRPEEPATRAEVWAMLRRAKGK